MIEANQLMAMRAACAEGRRFIGASSPNPPVGAAALAAEGRLLGVAAHQRAGDLHAEALLIRNLREQGLLDQIAALCVTLEPCNHTGRTPPCTQAIVAAGIKQVVIGIRDPNPQVTGGGIAALEQAGITVTTGMAEQECRQLMHGFLTRVITNRPFITVKRAFNRAGSMIPPVGQRTFASPASLVFAHRLRKKADAILTGSGTILADDPLYTVRHVEEYPHNRRLLAILDRRRRVPASYLHAARQRGLDPVIYDDIESALANLASKGAQDILVEAGPALADALLANGQWHLTADIRQTAGPVDAITANFNPALPPPFDPDQFDWQWMLPT